MNAVDTSVVVAAFASWHEGLDGLMANQTVLRPRTVSTDTAGASEIVLCYPGRREGVRDHLAAQGHHIDPADVARLSPLGHPTINLQGRYRTTSRAPTGGLRPLRTADQHG